MNHEHEFDELARRKLAERDFPFQEAHWLEAQRAIAAQSKGRRGGALWMVGGAAALIIAAWLLWPANEAPVVAEVNGTGTAAQVEAGVTGNEMEGANAYSAEVTTTEAEVENTTVHQPANNEPARQRPVRERSAMNAGGGTLADATNADDLVVNTPDAGRPTSPEAPSAGHIDPMTTQPVNDATANVKIDPFPPEPVITTTDPLAMVAPSDPANNAVNVPDPMTNTVAPDPQADDPGTLTTPQITPVDPAQNGPDPVNMPVKSDPIPVVAAPTTDPVPVDPTPVLPTVVADPSDPPIAATAQPNDSTNVPPEPIPVAPPLITPRSPWELAALFGAFNTTSTYAGGNSAAWDVGTERTYGGGAELMHMGRNFGLGVGVHYGTYADRLRTPEESRSVLNTTPSWYFQPVDTTIMIVLGYDSTTGGWITQNVDVTINELRMALDSSYANVLIREARERINRTSYVEAVGLVDAHLVQGRWSFGIRGGPSIGLLTTRSGSIPSTNSEEVAFNDMATKSMVIGWTARAYIRYRFNAAWSVGIEPAARGQLFNGLEHESVARRSSAMGVMLSLSYRLP